MGGTSKPPSPLSSVVCRSRLLLGVETTSKGRPPYTRIHTCTSTLARAQAPCTRTHASARARQVLRTFLVAFALERRFAPVAQLSATFCRSRYRHHHSSLLSYRYYHRRLRSCRLHDDHRSRSFPHHFHRTTAAIIAPPHTPSHPATHRPPARPPARPSTNPTLYNARALSRHPAHRGPSGPTRPRARRAGLSGPQPSVIEPPRPQDIPSRFRSDARRGHPPPPGAGGARTPGSRGLGRGRPLYTRIHTHTPAPHLHRRRAAAAAAGQCRTVSNIIRACSTGEEIRQRFGIPNDFTPEEEEEIRRENAWCEPP